MDDLFPKDPAAVLDYRFDWKPLTNAQDNAISDWLASTETISSHSVTASTGLTVDSSELASTNTAVIAWLSGGTAGRTYRVTCQIVTSAGRTDERSITIQCVNR